MRKLLLALALVLVPAIALAQQVYAPIPYRAAPLGSTSGNIAAATATATLGTADGQTTFICGFSVQSLGATAATTVTLTITGISGTFNYSYFSVAGATTANPLLVVPFTTCLPASGPNTSIVVSLPSLGAGNTNASVNAWGFRY